VKRKGEKESGKERKGKWKGKERKVKSEKERKVER